MSNPLTQTQRRRSTAALWTSANPTLAAGEVGFETDTRKMKIGDGTTVWTSLPYWATPAAPTKLVQFAVPVGKTSNGTMGNNGALSGITALPTTYAAIYLYFGANVIAVGVAAGWYYTIMSSTTAGTVYNNPLGSGAPVVIASPTAFATVGPGAFTQVTSSDVALTLVVAGNTIGLTGQTRLYTLLSQSNTAQSKTITVSYGGTNIYAQGAAAVDSRAIWRVYAERGVSNAQVTTSSGSAAAGGAAVAPTYTAIDETVSQNITIELQINATPASNWIILEAVRIILD